MEPRTLKELVQHREEPAVSIFCPFDTRQPGNPHDSAELRELRDQATSAVGTMLDASAAAFLIARIDEAVASIDLHHPSEGVAVFVSPGLSRVVPLDEPVQPSAVVGERFAIRDLVSATSGDLRARIVVLSQERSRCIDLTDGTIAERRDFGFPVDVVAPTEADTPHGDFPLDEHEHAEAVKFVLRAVDRALGSLEGHDPRPLVLVGAERDLAYFDEVSDHRANIVGRLHGNHLRDTPEQIVRLVRPALEEYEREQQRDACDEVREAIGTHAVSGIAESWLAARAGRGHRLVVEDRFRFPVHLVEGSPEPAPEDEDSFDAVTDIMAEVLRHDGDIVVVPAGDLDDLSHVALLTRY